jgi:hypothetical protein
MGCLSASVLGPSILGAIWPAMKQLKPKGELMTNFELICSDLSTSVRPAHHIATAFTLTRAPLEQLACESLLETLHKRFCLRCDR